MKVLGFGLEFSGLGLLTFKLSHYIKHISFWQIKKIELLRPMRLRLRMCVCVCRRRKRSASRRSSRLDAAGRSRTQAKLSVSNFYDLYDSIEMARSPSVLLPLTPTSIIKHSDLLNAQQPDEYVPMKVP